MKQYIEISCRHCGADDLVKNGRSENGTQRYRCNKCGKSFQHEYTYNAWKLGVKEQTEKQTLNSYGVRDISRNIDISKDTVISELRKKKTGGSESALHGASEQFVILRAGN
ncbi:transposase-like zinc-binding domain-containing protein [Candidatus Electronema sp. JM]|uniref:IS1/IS1595 family N-terminal zinc-binding domain-containing protein n=1 Tax=Candidatus Electronema sp. JM TaxID=3401571 RepID=UPI003AA8EA9A